MIVANLSGVDTYGASDGLGGYSIGWVSCNVGDAPASYIAATNEHPVMSQAIYRLKDGRFEQIGLSGVLHGFAALAQSYCCPPGETCCRVPDTLRLFGAGCSDPHSAAIAGAQDLLSPRFEINAYTGQFPFPPTSVAMSDPPKVYERRLTVRQADLDPALNDGTAYFVEIQYVSADEAAAGHHDNNTSYRRVFVPGALFNGAFALITAYNEPTIPESPAMFAWKAFDPHVHIVPVRVLGEGLFYLAARATDLDNGFWDYEYALYNLNSHRFAGSFNVPMMPGTTIQNVGFHEVDYHSGKPFDRTDWQATIGEDSITWGTTPFAIDENANALRWGTLYNFRFQADSPPTRSTVTIGLFRPSEPDVISAPVLGPL